MLLVCRRDAMVGEQPLQVARSCFVISQPDGRIDHPIDAIDTHRCMHAQCDVEFSAAEDLTQRWVRSPAFGFIENDKLHARDIRHQARFGFTDDPGQSRLWPRVLNRPDNGQCMTGISDVREPHEADTFWRRFTEH